MSTGLPVDGLCPDPDGPPPKPPAKPKDRFASKVLPADVIPDDLLDCQQLLPEWWSVKAKGRTEVAFTRACAFLRKYAPDERQLVLETAIMGGHQGLYPPREDRQAPGRFLSERERNRAACDRLADAIDNGGFLL